MKNSNCVAAAGLAGTLAMACLGVNASGNQADRTDARTQKVRIVTVVKRTGIGWFERRAEGIQLFAAQNGVDATMTGAEDADPQKQAAIIRKLIAEKPAAHPDIKAFEGSSVVDVAGIGRAVREAGLQDKTCVMGTSLPSVAGEFLSDAGADVVAFRGLLSYDFATR